MTLSDHTTTRAEPATLPSSPCTRGGTQFVINQNPETLNPKPGRVRRGGSTLNPSPETEPPHVQVHESKLVLGDVVRPHDHAR